MNNLKTGSFLTNNVPVVNMVRVVMIMMRENPFRGLALLLPLCSWVSTGSMCYVCIAGHRNK